MRVTRNREPKAYKIEGTVFMIKPASKDDLSKYYRESVYELQRGDSTDADPHKAEFIALKNHVVGWDESLLDEDENPLPYSAATVESTLKILDQADRQALYYAIISPSNNRNKLVAAEKNA